MRIRQFLTHSVPTGTLAVLGIFLLVILFVVYRNPATLAISNVATSSVLSSTSSLLAAVEKASTTPSDLASSTASNSPIVPASSPTILPTASAPAATLAAATSQQTASAAISTTPASPAISSAVQAQHLTSAGGQLLKSMVNIVCISADPSIPSISGSGVIIDSRGVILTAAHVGQFFLLQDADPSKVQCIVRAGSPARRAYTAEPIYVSPTWIANNPGTITAAAPKGTGENDFALIGITGTATSTPLPSSFPSIPLATQDLQLGDQVAIGSFGAQYLSSSELNTSLYPILVFGAIQNRYTFNTNTVDLVTIVGSAASQEGSSGGGIVDSAGALDGVITTSSVSGDISSRSLNAITVSHIRRSYTADTGGSIDSLLAGNSVPGLVANFSNESKTLGNKLLASI
jgi:hypothetical protein